jgi:hypothetical protein
MALARKFELTLRDNRKLNAFIKVCEAMCSHSDTALFKVKSRGVYIMLTDLNSLCAVEVRVLSLADCNFELNCNEFSAKVLLDEFGEDLKKFSKSKRGVVLFATKDHELRLQEVGASASCPVANTEHRMRVFHILSTREFVKKSKSCVKFSMVNVEFNKIVNSQAVMSGSHGGVPMVRATPKSATECEINFFLENNCGAFASVKIHTSTQAEDVRIHTMPKATIEIPYLLTYLKRSQNLLNFPTDCVTVFISERGILLQTGTKDGITALVFTSNIDGIDLDSFA